MTSFLKPILKTGIFGGAVWYGIDYYTNSLIQKLPALPEETDEKVRSLADKMGVDNTRVVFRAHDKIDGTLGMYPYTKTVVLLSPQTNNLIMAHELAHVQRRHYWKTYVYSLATIATLSLVRRSLVHTFGISRFIATPFCLGTAVAIIRKQQTDHEKEADVVGSQFVGAKDVAGAMHYLRQTHETNEFALKIVKATMPTFNYFWFRSWSALKDVHPPFNERIDYLKRIYYEKNPSQTIELQIGSNRFVLTEEQSRSLRTRINASKRQNYLFAFEKICIDPYAGKKNVIFEFYQREPNRLTISTDTIENYFNSGMNFEQLEKIVDEACQSPFWVDITLRTSSSEAALKLLRTTMPEYDWKHARVTTGAGVVNIFAQEKIQPHKETK